ncbi:MAG: MFS transporter [Actinomycetota bacterium]
MATRWADLTDRLRSNERLLAICGSTVLVMAGQGVVSPVLPLYAREFGVSTATVGLTLTAFGIARLVLNLPAGALAERYGRRLLLIGGPAITAIGMLGSGTAQGIEQLLAWRLVAGAGSALYMTGAQIYLVDIAAPSQRARYLATNQGALLAGVSIGPAVGGLLADAFDLRTPFFVVGAMALGAVVYGWFRLPETRSTVEPDDAPPADRSARAVLRFTLSRDLVAVGLVTAAIFTARSGARQTLMPLLGVEDLGLTAGQLGLVFTVSGVVSLALIGPAAAIADRFGRKIAIVPTSLLAALGITVVALGDSAAVFVAGSVVMALGTGVSGPAPGAFVADIAPPELRGVAMGIYRTWGDLGIVVAPPALGALADRTSITTALLVDAAVVAASALWFAAAVRERRVN